MDWTVIRSKVLEWVKKYKFVVMILALGMILMALPDHTEDVQQETVQTSAEPQSGTSAELEKILEQIDGAGKVRVLITQASGAETIYQTDDDSSYSDDTQSIRTETVTISDGNRVQTGLVRQVNPPVYLGAIVICQGADRPSVRLGIVEAVANVTGISTDRITVLKMK